MGNFNKMNLNQKIEEAVNNVSRGGEYIILSIFLLRLSCRASFQENSSCAILQHMEEAETIKINEGEEICVKCLATLVKASGPRRVLRDAGVLKEMRPLSRKGGRVIPMRLPNTAAIISA